MTGSALRVAAEKNPMLIPEPYDAIFDQFGFDGLKLVVDVLGGQSLYVPSLRTVLADCIKAEAAREFREGKHPLAKIAKKYGYTSRLLSKHVKCK